MQDGIPSARGSKKWHITVIMQMLTNPAYRGDLTYQRSYVVDPISKKSRKNNGELPRYYASEMHEYIIEPFIWDAVQLEMERRRTYWEKHRARFNFVSEDAPFVGRVICGSCGLAFRKNKGSKYMSCTSYDKYREPADRERFVCHELRIKQTDPEQAFIKAWNTLAPVAIFDGG